MTRKGTFMGASALFCALALYTCPGQEDKKQVPRATSESNSSSTETPSFERSSPPHQRRVRPTTSRTPFSLSKLRDDPFIKIQRDVTEMYLDQENTASYLCRISGGTIYLQKGETVSFVSPETMIVTTTIVGGDEEYCEENPMRGFIDGNVRDFYHLWYEYQNIRSTSEGVRRWADPNGSTLSLEETIQSYPADEQQKILYDFDLKYRDLLTEQIANWRDEDPTPEQKEIIDCLEQQLSKREYTEEGIPEAFKLYTCFPQ